jgi:hypothetical protein
MTNWRGGDDTYHKQLTSLNRECLQVDKEKINCPTENGQKSWRVHKKENTNAS